MGFLYVDGHVRAYHGERTISRAFVARRHLAMPATTDYWVNDSAGDPLLLITGDLNAALTKAFPNLLKEVRAAIGERRVTIVFDRGGWSPKLFQTLLREGFDILTYRKGKGRLINAKRFLKRRAKLEGHWVSYDLHDQPVRFLKGKLRLRQVTRLCGNGHQTQIITSRTDLRDIEVAYRMFERWRQENFFKYMREEFLLDARIADHAGTAFLTASNARRAGLMRTAQPNGNNVPGHSTAPSLRRASAPTRRPRLPRVTGPSQHPLGHRPGTLKCPKTGHLHKGLCQEV